MYRIFSKNENPAPIAAPYKAASIKNAHLRYLRRTNIHIPFIISSIIGSPIVPAFGAQMANPFMIKYANGTEMIPKTNDDSSTPFFTKEKLSNHNNIRMNKIGGKRAIKYSIFIVSAVLMRTSNVPYFYPFREACGHILRSMLSSNM